MSAIASPRLSSSMRSAASSTRTSLDAPAGRTNSHPRRNRADRAALRDYYGLKATESGDSGTPPAPRSPGLLNEDGEGSELDQEGFDAQKYVRHVLANESLESVLKIESGLLSEIRGLDGERKALVYDNYSKLIAATDTIRKMRTNMDPLTPTTSTLAPAISHIAETAASLSASLIDKHARQMATETKDRDENTMQAQQTVRWVLATPNRLASLLEEGRREEAEQDWAEVRTLLAKWKGVAGVERVQNSCEDIMKQETA